MKKRSLLAPLNRRFRTRIASPAEKPSIFRAARTVEPLESRIVLATFTGAGASLAIDLANANESVTFSTDGTTITATLVGGTAVDGGGTGGNVTGFTTSTASITSAGFTSINVTDSSTGNSVGFGDSTG